MMMGEMQKPLFKKEPSSDSNRAVAFGVTNTGLNEEGSYDVLENIFYGMRNIEISPEIMSVENPAGILADYFATGSLKRRDAHEILDIPHDFFMLVNYLNLYSHNNKGFAHLAHEFKKCFDDSPREQKKRFELLNPSVKNKFVNSFFATYKPSNKENLGGFYDPNCDGESKGVYADRIYKEFKFLSDRLKN